MLWTHLVCVSLRLVLDSRARTDDKCFVINEQLILTKTKLLKLAVLASLLD